MNVIIIEDEKPAVEKLRKSITKSDTSIQILATPQSIAEAKDWLKQNPSPDLIFMDIELGDGLSFKLFEEVSIKCPVIFTTAYDEYWQQAFEHNSIDYLLKPVNQGKLDAALLKYARLREHFNSNMQGLLNWQQQSTKAKSRFLVKRGADYVSIKTEEIAYFYASHKIVCMVNNQGQKFILDESLAELESQLDPSSFYRLNRKYLVNVNAIKRIKSFPKSKLQVELAPAVEEEIVIAQENVSAFKEWMSR
jgi:two-component system LytT family response regulator